MPVYCASCGGELFGAVNRCWHCRRSFSKPPSQDGRPAVRRAPVVIEGVSPASEPVVIAEEPKSKDSPQAVREKSSEAKGEAAAIGSPFSPGWTMPRPERGRQVAAPSPAAIDPDADEIGKWCALVSIACGGGGLVASAYFPWPIPLAWIGLTCGGFGLKNHRFLASAGFVLCCLLLFAQGLFFTSFLYENIFGVDPWSAVFGP